MFIGTECLLALTFVTRYMAGDTSLIEEIHANAASDAPVQQLCCNALEFDADSFRRALPNEATQTALQACSRYKPTDNILYAHEKSWIELYPDDFTQQCDISSVGLTGGWLIHLTY